MANLRTRFIKVGETTLNIGYSENDFTNDLKAKLNGIEAGAQVNIIEQVQVDGQAVSVAGKSINITGLQHLLTAGSGIAIDPDNTIRVTIDHTVFKVVDSLPAKPATGDENRIHVVPSSKGETGNQYKEYIWVVKDGTGKWEEFGDFHASLDLADYYKKGEADAKFVAKVSGYGLSKNDFTDALKAKLDGIAINANKVDISYDTDGETLIFTTNA